jgi:pantoate kinase
LLKAEAFVPGHITGFFEIYDEAEDVRQRGSRGAGICLSKGVRTTVEVTESKEQSIEILINDIEVDAKVTELVIKKIIGDNPYKVNVSSIVELPQGQGFGMSGAGALSTSLALTRATEIEASEDEVICTAHWAEIICGTGLGDVMPQSNGGAVIRKKEGCPPFGILEEMKVEEEEIVLCIIGFGLSTRDIITNPQHRDRINKFGDDCLRELNKKPDLKEMMGISLDFSRNTGLISAEMEKAITVIGRYGSASMSMLGNSIFALGDTENLVNQLNRFGEVYVCTIDKEGMRMVEDG